MKNLHQVKASVLNDKLVLEVDLKNLKPLRKSNSGKSVLLAMTAGPVSLSSVGGGSRPGVKFNFVMWREVAPWSRT